MPKFVRAVQGLLCCVPARSDLLTANICPPTDLTCHDQNRRYQEHAKIVCPPGPALLHFLRTNETRFDYTSAPAENKPDVSRSATKRAKSFRSDHYFRNIIFGGVGQPSGPIMGAQVHHRWVSRSGQDTNGPPDHSFYLIPSCIRPPMRVQTSGLHLLFIHPYAIGHGCFEPGKT